MALRLQCAGFIIRLGAYMGDGYKEGVSLTVYDELARWEKYAYGCNELLFHPIRFWPIRGPFTPLFRKFLFSKIRFTSKITITLIHWHLLCYRSFLASDCDELLLNRMGERISRSLVPGFIQNLFLHNHHLQPGRKHRSRRPALQAWRERCASEP